MHTVHLPPTPLRQKWPITGRVSPCQHTLCQGHWEEFLSQKMPEWVPSKDKWASWVLESILFLVFASVYQEEAEVLAGGQGAGLDALTVYAVWVSGCP